MNLISNSDKLLSWILKINTLLVEIFPFDAEKA